MGTFIKCHIYQFIKNAKMHKIDKSQKCKIHKNVSKKCHFRGGLISALKPGPVVPPGIEKTPDQAARISQTVDFGHLSDILAFFRGGQILINFCHFFTFLIFLFLHFLVFVFCHFLWFYDFVDFHVFLISWFLIIFVTFSCCAFILITFWH